MEGMPSTACTCVGRFGFETYDVVVVDPFCRLHGEVSAVRPDASAAEPA